MTRLCLVRHLAVVLALLSPAFAGAQTRIPREKLSPVWRDAMLRGTVVKQTPTTADTLPARGNDVVLRADEVLVSRPATPQFERVVQSVTTVAGGRQVVTQDSVYRIEAIMGVVPGTTTRVSYETKFIRHGAAYFTGSGYEGSFSIAVEDMGDAPGPYELPVPVTVTFGGDPDRYDPPNVEVRRTGEPPTRIRLAGRAPVDTVAIEFHVRQGATTHRIPVQPSLAFISPPTRLQAFGVDMARYVIRARGPVAPGMVVGVNSTGGILDTNEVTLGASGTGVVRLRSGGGLGNVTLTATAMNMQDAVTDIAFVFPVLFLGFMLVGAAIGTLFAESRARKRVHVRTRTWRIVGAVAGAVIATTAYVGLGINLLRVVVTAPLANEIAVFAFAALGAGLGLALAAGGDSASEGRKPRRAAA